MGSVINDIECPNCGQEAFSDFYYKTGEEYINCQNCGYHYSATYKRDGDGKLFTKDGTENYALDNMIMEENELKNPYGAYRIKYYDSVGYECGSLETAENLNHILEQVMDNKDLESLTVTRLINGKIRTIHVIDNGPREAK
jgi:Zn ribbon nucleic-acid-binding protein